MLAAQQSAGNAAVSRMLARSPMAAPGPVGEITASISLLGYEATEEASAVRELALGPASGFQGFESEEEAAVAAAGTKMVGVVVADAEGRFHAYETDVEPVWGPIFSHVRHLEIEGGHVMRWTHLTPRGKRRRSTSRSRSPISASGAAGARRRVRSTSASSSTRSGSRRPSCTTPPAARPCRAR